MTDKPLVSICIPVYNGAAYLSEAIESALTQTYPAIEIVISDNGSSDDSLEIITHYVHNFPERISVIHNNERGIGSNWNHCVKHAKGEFIKFLFQDDLLSNDCVAKMVHESIISGCKIVVSKRHIIFETEETTEFRENWLANCLDLQKDLPTDSGQSLRISKNLFKQPYFLESPRNKISEPSGSLIHKSVFDEIGFFNLSLSQILDYEFWYRYLLIGDILVLPEKLVSFRIHSNQASNINYYADIPDEKEWQLFLRKSLFWHMSLRNKFITLRRTSAFINNVYNVIRSIFK